MGRVTIKDLEKEPNAELWEGLGHSFRGGRSAGRERRQDPPDAQQKSDPVSASPKPAYHTLVNTYCLSCHNNKMKAGGLELDAINAQRPNDHRTRGKRSFASFAPGRCRRFGARRPDEAAYTAALASLEPSLDRLAAATPNPGRTETFRRLNRTEYHNAIRDLLALDFDVAALLPSDSSSYGFDNVTVGNLSPTLLERYVSAAEKISRLAVGRPGLSERDDRQNQARPHAGEHVEGLPLGTRGGALVITRSRRTAIRDHDPPGARPQRAHRGPDRAHESSCCSTASGCGCLRSSRCRSTQEHVCGEHRPTTTSTAT